MPTGDDGQTALARVCGVGNHQPEELTHGVALPENGLGRAAVRDMLRLRPGGPMETFADVGDLTDVGFGPETPIEDGMRDLFAWYRRECNV
jgi:UDP-glucuronate 4-epimerase